MKMFVHPHIGHFVAEAEANEPSLLASYLQGDIHGSEYSCAELLDLVQSVLMGKLVEADYSGDIHECTIEKDGVHIRRWDGTEECDLSLGQFLQYLRQWQALIKNESTK